MQISRTAVTSAVVATCHLAPLVAIAAILVLVGAATVFLPWFSRQPRSVRVDIIRLVSALRREGSAAANDRRPLPNQVGVPLAGAHEPRSGRHPVGSP